MKDWVKSVRATREEKTRALPGDERIPQAIDTLTHGVTIRRPPRDVWPWLVQMGAGTRAGWYSYDWLDNGRRPSATRIVPELQHPAVGTIFPALPGVTDGFVVLAIERERVLLLGWPAANGTLEVTWTFEGQATFFAAYDAAMKMWPVSYEELEIPSQFGMTHVIATGTEDGWPSTSR